MKSTALLMGIALVGLIGWSPATAEEPLKLADGKVQMQPPEGWITKKPRVSLIEAEFELPGPTDDVAPGRLTIMQSGGTIDQNIDRWKGQFSETDASKVEEIKVAGCKVHMVDLSGVYKEQRGPFAPATLRKDYRMLGAIIETGKAGNYFVKLTGPTKTLAKHADDFAGLIKSLKLE